MSEPSSCTPDLADARTLQSLILRRAALIRNGDIAQVCQRDDSWVSRVLAGETGVRIDQLAAFLGILGLKVCDKSALTVDRARYRALTHLALAEVQRAAFHDQDQD